MSELRKLIETTEYKMENKDPSVRRIKYPKLFISSLKELESMIGFPRLKNMIALQTMELIRNMNSEKKKSGMLHTVIYAPPGTGKTTVGTILAQIWYSLGYLDNTTEVPSKTRTDDELIQELIQAVYIFVIVYKFLKYLYYEKPYIIVLLAVLIPLSYILYRVVEKNSDTKLANDVSDGKVDPRKIIKVVSRKDFVAEYLGQTAPKTEALLNKNRGKVLFIDEAYSLYQGNPSYGSGDPYGEEALTTLNQYMSENKDAIAIIFAGYQDKMVEGIFKAQPGLARRCQFHFEIDKYTPRDLARIFQKQLKKDDYTLENIDSVEKLIQDNYDSFKNFGGDTERLKNYVLMEKNKNLFLKDDEEDSVIRETDVVNGITKLTENDITGNKKTYNRMEDLLNGF